MVQVKAVTKCQNVYMWMNTVLKGICKNKAHVERLELLPGRAFWVMVGIIF